jgi:hypothetical protein
VVKGDEMKRALIVVLLLVSVLAVVPSASAQALPEQTSELMVRLANTSAFVGRYAFLLAQQAWVVRLESVATENHARRLALAEQVLTNPYAYAQATVLSFVTRPATWNVDTTDPLAIRCGAEDNTLLTQIAGDWNKMAGV